jgi:hypothetical protein
MSLRFIALLLLAISILAFPSVTNVYSDNSMSLNTCQELLNNARSYDSRATWYNRVAQGLMQQIQNMAQQPKTQATVQAMDNLFQQYDQNRQMENQMRQLSRQLSDQAQQCMKTVN